MRVLFLTDNFPPESNAPANRTYEHALEWINKGAEVTVITCVPNFPHGKTYAGFRNKLWQTEMKNGIRVIRVWSYMAGNAGVLRRTLDYVSFAVTAFFAALFVKTDVIIATTPQFFTATAGYAAALCKFKPWIMEVRDLWPESIKAVDAIKHERVIDFLEKIELFLYRKATRIVVVTDAFKKNISGRGIPQGKIDVVKNGVVLRNYPELPKSQELLTKHKLHGKFIVGYMGTHGLAHKLDFVLDCAAAVTDPNVHFVFVGNGAKREELLAQKKRLNLANVSLLPSVTKAQTRAFISIFDVALVNLRRSDTFKTVIPSKIFENAAMGKPILLGLEGESRVIIDEYGAGRSFEPENTEEFMRVLQTLQTDKKVYAECRSGALVLAQNFSRRAAAAKMYKIIERTASGQDAPVALREERIL